MMFSHRHCRKYQESMQNSHSLEAWTDKHHKPMMRKKVSSHWQIIVAVISNLLNRHCSGNLLLINLVLHWSPWQCCSLESCLHTWVPAGPQQIIVSVRADCVALALLLPSAVWGVLCNFMSQCCRTCRMSWWSDPHRSTHRKPWHSSLVVIILELTVMEVASTTFYHTALQTVFQVKNWWNTFAHCDSWLLFFFLSGFKPDRDLIRKPHLAGLTL